MPYQITSIHPKGDAAIALDRLTVLVGPNNCGKSQTLKDIREFSSTNSRARLVVLESVTTTLPTESEFRAGVQVLPHDVADHINLVGVRDDLMSQVSFGAHKSWFDHVFGSDANKAYREGEILRPLGTSLIAYLGAEARFKLTASSVGFNPRSAVPSNAIQALNIADQPVMAELRRAFRMAFKMDIGLDWAAMTHLCLRVAPDFGEIPDSRSELDKLMCNAAELEMQGDGFRSFSGIALALLAYPNRVVLLDEPEAFLHPAQARVLGSWIAEQAANRPAQIIVATHSADFLAGLVATGPGARILRLNRTAGTKFHQIPHAVTRGLVESPLLSSQPVLDSLFHRGVVICEGDPDRAVYQTVAQRFASAQGAQDFLFIHSNGKDAVKIPSKLLRESGTPVCVIADFDVLNSEETLAGIVEGLTGRGLDESTKMLRAEVSSAVEAQAFEQAIEDLKKQVAAWLSEPGDDIRQARRRLIAAARAGSNKWGVAKKSGVLSLPEPTRQAARNLIRNLSAVGLFVVPCGELESWIQVGVDKGSAWNQRALQSLHDGCCPEDLRTFVRKVLEFLDR